MGGSCQLSVMSCRLWDARRRKRLLGRALFLMVVAVALLGMGCEWGKKARGAEEEAAEEGMTKSGIILDRSHQIVTRTWKVPADFLEILCREVDDGSRDDPFADDGLWDGPGARTVCRNANWRPREALEEAGIYFPPGTGLEFSPTRGELVMTNTGRSQALFGKLIESLGPLKHWVVDEGLFYRLESEKEKKERLANERAKKVVERKLKEIVIPVVEFNDTTVVEAVDFLHQKTREFDGDEPRGVDFHIRRTKVEKGLDGEEGINPETARVRNLSLRDVPVLTVMQYLYGSTKLRYKIDHAGVAFLLLGPGVTEELTERKWHVAQVLMGRLDQKNRELDLDNADPFGGAKEIRDDSSLVAKLEKFGIEFRSGAAVEYDEKTEVLRMVNDSSNHEITKTLMEVLALEVSRERALEKERVR